MWLMAGQACQTVRCRLRVRLHIEHDIEAICFSARRNSSHIRVTSTLGESCLDTGSASGAFYGTDSSGYSKRNQNQ